MRKVRRAELFAAVASARRWLGWLLLVAAAGNAVSQSVSGGEIAGVVVDGNGAPISRAGVSARNLETSELWRCEAMRDGAFALHGLGPGEYQLEVQAGQAGAAVSTLLQVDAGAALDVRLVIDGASGTAAIEAASGSDSPLTEAEPDTNGDARLSVRGIAQLDAALDGVSATQAYGAVPVGTGRNAAVDVEDDPDSAEATTGPTHGLGRGRHAGVAYLYAEGSVREFRVGTAGYSAQAGSPGGVLTAVTRSGGDTLHGSLLLQAQSSALAARSPLAVATRYADGVVTGGEVKPRDLRLHAAATLGGALSRLGPHWGGVSFLLAGDLQRRGFPAVSSPADVNFYNLTAVQTDLLGNRGVSSAQTRSALNFLSSLTGDVARRADEDIQFGRLDWRARPRLSLATEYNRVRWSSPAGLLESPVVARGRASLGNAAGSVDQGLLRISPRWSARTSQELRLAWTHDLQYERPQSPLPQETAISPGGLSPEVNIGPGGLLFGTPASLSQVAYPDEQRLEAGDVMTIVRGHHLLRIGGTFAYVQESVATLANAAGTFRYDSGATRGLAGGLVDFISDYAYSAQGFPSEACPRISAADHLFCFRSYSQSFGEQHVEFSTQEWTGFAEETWRPRPNARRGLRLHAGLRYEYALLPLPQRPNPALDAIFGQRGRTSVLPEDRNNLGPRLSATFEPLGRGRLLMKAGYGVYFGRMPGATIQAALSDTALISSTVKIRLRPSAVVACPQAPTQGFGYLCSFAAPPPGVTGPATSSVVFDRRFRLPVVQQGSFELERDLGRGSSVGLALVINADRQLPTSTDLNIAPSTGFKEYQLQGGSGAAGVRDQETFVVPEYTARLSPSFGPVTDVVSSANAYYDGLIFKLAVRPARALRVAATYTWSKAIDFAPGSSATPRTNGQFDPFNDRYDKGLSSLNYPQSLHATAVWTPRSEAGRGLRGLAAGWTISAITVARSGRPYTYDVSGGTYLPGGHESLNGSGGAQYLPTVGRNTLRLPSTLKTDLRVGRGFRLGRARATGSIEAFNLFNHQSVTSVNQRAFLVGTAVNGVTPLVFQSASAIQAEGLNTTAFGTRTGSGTSLNRERQVEFGIRLAF